MMAAKTGSYESTKALLDAGADVYLGRDILGRTAADIANVTASGQEDEITKRLDQISLEEAGTEAKRVAELLAPFLLSS